MIPAINAWTLPSHLSPEEQIDATADAGLAGLELVMGDAGPLTPDTPPERFAELGRYATDKAIGLVGLATGLFFESNFASRDARDRQRAMDLACSMLDQAVGGGIDAILVVPAVVGKAQDTAPTTDYADALHRTLEGLTGLAPEAEARGVTIAIENVWNRFLLSPLEAADVIDRVGSPHVRFYFDTGNVMPFGYPQDWIATLGGRIARVHIKDFDLSRPGPEGFCPLGAGSVDWPPVIQALRAVGYDGPLTFEGPGDPARIARQLDEIVAGRSPTIQTEE